MATFTSAGHVGIRRYVPVTIQLYVSGIDGVPRVFLHQKSVRWVNVDGGGAPYKRPVFEWWHLLTFDRPRWCRLVDKPVEEAAQWRTM